MFFESSFFVFALLRFRDWRDLLWWGSPFAFARPRCKDWLVSLGRLTPACRWRCPRSPARALPLTCQGAHPLDPAPLRG
jgi:hypothetical protein